MRPGPLHHVGIVVPSIADALPFWRDTLGYAHDEPREVPGSGVKVCFIESGDGRIELVEPLDPASGVARFLAERGRSTIHHVCFAVPDIRAALADLAAQGVRLVDAAPRLGAEGLVAFLHPSAADGVLVELLELRPTHGAGAHA